MDRYLDNQKNYRTLVNTPLATARLNSVEAGGRVYRVRECPRIPLLQNEPRDHPLAVMLYVRFPLSLRNVEDLLHERGIVLCQSEVTYFWSEERSQR